MTSKFCGACGAQLASSAISCPKCGASQQPELNSKGAQIDSLNQKWKERFELIEKVGWDEGIFKNIGNTKNLSLSERLKLQFNILAAVFGPIYYLFKGMWIKGIFIFTVIMIVDFALMNLGIDTTYITMGLTAGWFGGYANYDYYLYKVKNKSFY